MLSDVDGDIDRRLLEAVLVLLLVSVVLDGTLPVTTARSMDPIVVLLD